MSEVIIVENWKDLCNLVESVNPTQSSIKLAGWVNKTTTTGLKIDKLMFKVVDVDFINE